MLSYFASTRARIAGSRNGWCVASVTSVVPECQVELEIQGEDRNGYHLVECPEGFSFGDSSHETLRDAMDTALARFGVQHDEWQQRQ